MYIYRRERGKGKVIEKGKEKGSQKNVHIIHRYNMYIYATKWDALRNVCKDVDIIRTVIGDVID